MALRETDRSEAEERELAVLQWTADFVARGRRRAEAMATPWFPINSLEQAVPSATRVRLSGVGHVPWLEAPDEFRTALLDFLRQARPKTSGAAPR
ncbi:alpha/beta fold hydrolase [Amycolatopsis sp. lyj-112]|uniref:alpha/beta fold hydrolase n=1 Tax=Amycolatopsis sp. lyj-112 TaxID=2789288 RepID=UPI00397A1CA5